jgi:hypothetical protein
MSFSDEDIILYSKAFYGRYRERSLSLAVQRSAELASFDDQEGVVVWQRVAQEVKDLAAADGLYLGTPEEAAASFEIDETV